MPSSLTGLHRSLTWSNFATREGNPPAPGTHAAAAYTWSSYTEECIYFVGVRGSRPAQYQLRDSFRVAITFNTTRSWVMSWVSSEPQQFQTDLLNHEQGHYNITALVSRDYFVDVMLLKLQTFSSARQGVTACQAIQRKSVAKIRAIHRLYDKEAHPEQEAGLSRGPIQQAWDRWFQTAFTQARTPASQSADGTPHKVRLIDVLNKNGKSV